MRPHIRQGLALFTASVKLTLAGVVPALAQDASPEASGSPAAASSAPVSSTSECVEPEASTAPVTDGQLSMPEAVRIALFIGVWEGIRDFYLAPDT